MVLESSMVKKGVNKKEMRNPQMHCPNPDCVDDYCHGDCLTLTEKSDDCCGNSLGNQQGTEESRPFRERREEYISKILECN